MTLVVLVSAKGAPGVTTLTVALAALTPGAVAADLDPDGGDLALRYRREDGSPLDLDRGLLSLAASLRRGPNDFVGSGPIDAHLQVTGGGLEVLLGVKGPDQAVGLGPLWSPLARALTETGRPVFADCGRIGPASPAMPVLMVADAVIMVARAELEELAHLRERLRFLVATLPSRYSGRARVGVVLVAAERDRAAGPRTEQLLRSSGVAVSVLGTVADDARGAGRLRGLAGGRAGRTTLVRSVRSLLPAIRVLAGDVPEVTRLRTGPGLLTPATPELEPAPEPEPAPAQISQPAAIVQPAIVQPAPIAQPAQTNGRHAPGLPPPLLTHAPPPANLDDDTAERPPVRLHHAPRSPAVEVLELDAADATAPAATACEAAAFEAADFEAAELEDAELDITEPEPTEPETTEPEASERESGERAAGELNQPRLDPLTSPYRPALFTDLALHDDVPAAAGPNGGE